MLKLAWRNIWRNKGRSFISIAAVMFSVIFALVLRSFQVGVWDHMIHEIVGENFGYIQIHKKGFWNDQSLDNSLELSRLSEDSIRAAHPSILGLIPRVESFSLVSTGEVTKGTMVMGIDPSKELGGLQLDQYMLSGTPFSVGDQSVVVAEKLAEYLGVQTGDTLLFIGQGYHAATAYGRYVVSGIARIRNPELNKQLVLMPLPEAQWMYNCTDMATSVVVQLEEGAHYAKVASALATLDTSAVEVMDWEALFPELVQTIEADKAGGLIFVTILYIIIFFVLLGTVIMMVAERQREFGILVAIGMRKERLAYITVLENLMLTLGGALLGMALVKPIQYYFKYHPIDLTGQMREAVEQYNFEPMLYTTTSWMLNVNHAFYVFLIGISVSVYAVWKIMTIEPINAMRS